MIRVGRYDYLWGYTAAQVELMVCDAPVIKYKKDTENKPKPGQKGFKVTAEQAQAAYDKWKARQEAEKKAGIKMDLEAFIKTGERVPVRKGE